MMLRLFVRFVRVYFAAWLQAFSRKGRSHAPLSLQRLLLLLIGFPLFFALQLLHWVGFLLDDILFRRYRTVSLQDALFISGMPRSGTTFVHRLLASDRHSFTTIATWEAFLAPSVTAKLTLMAMARCDAVFGSPLQRVTRFFVRQTTRHLDDIHSVGPEAPEEDYLLLLPVGGCFLAALAFPASTDFRHLADFSRLPASEQADLAAFHRRCLQAHLYARGRGRRLLSKNAAFATWLPLQQQLYPHARFIICFREPRKGLSSQLSSIKPAQRAFAADKAGTTAARTFPGIFREGLRALAEVSRSPSATQRVAFVDQADLRTHSAALLRCALVQIHIPIGQHLHQTFLQQQAQEEDQPHQSNHHHSPGQMGLDENAFATETGPLYKELRRKSVKVRR